jgi:hypothetical protein
MVETFRYFVKTPLSFLIVVLVFETLCHRTLSEADANLYIDYHQRRMKATANKERHLALLCCAALNIEWGFK